MGSLALIWIYFASGNVHLRNVVISVSFPSVKIYKFPKLSLIWCIYGCGIQHRLWLPYCMFPDIGPCSHFLVGLSCPCRAVSLCPPTPPEELGYPAGPGASSTHSAMWIPSIILHLLYLESHDSSWLLSRCAKSGILTLSAWDLSIPGHLLSIFTYSKTYFQWDW